MMFHIMSPSLRKIYTIIIIAIHTDETRDDVIIMVTIPDLKEVTIYDVCLFQTVQALSTLKLDGEVLRSHALSLFFIIHFCGT